MPYSEIKLENEVITEVMSGRLPAIQVASRSSYENVMRKICTQCWSQDPTNRPSVEKVLEELRAPLPADVNNTISKAESGSDVESLSPSTASIDQVLELVRTGDKTLEAFSTT